MFEMPTPPVEDRNTKFQHKENNKECRDYDPSALTSENEVDEQGRFLLTQRDSTDKDCESKNEDDERSSSQYINQLLDHILAYEGSN